MIVDLDQSKTTLADMFDLSHAPEAISAAVMDGLKSGKLPNQLRIDPENVSHDLAKLVLSLVEFIRQLLEAQAIRRLDSGSLTEEQEERLSMTLFNAREKVLELAAAFGIPAEELTLDLGPLGRLV